MSVTSNPTPGDELIPDTSGLPDLSGAGAEASSPEGAPERDVMAPWGEAGPPGLQWRADILGEGYESRTIELLDTARHGAGMPVLEQTARAEPEWEFRGRLLRRRLIRAEDHRRLVIGALVPAHTASKTLIAIHLDANLVVAIGLLAIGKTPLGGQPLPIDLTHGPRKAMMRQILVIGSKLLSFHLELLFSIDGSCAFVQIWIRERAVLLPNRTVNFARIAIEVVFLGIPNEAKQTRERIFAVNCFAFKHATRNFEQHPHIPLGIAHGLHGLFEHRGAALRIAELALALHPHCYGEHDVGILGRKRRIHLVHRDERVENARVLAIFA